VRSGQSTHGYGKTKELVIEAHAQGLNIAVIAKKIGLTYSAVYNACKRANLDIRRTDRRGHGEVKNIVLTEHFQNNLTAVQIIRKHNLRKRSVYCVYKYCGIKRHK
jgi:hypothetical protein